MEHSTDSIRDTVINASVAVRHMARTIERTPGAAPPSVLHLAREIDRRCEEMEELLKEMGGLP